MAAVPAIVLAHRQQREEHQLRQAEQESTTRLHDIEAVRFLKAAKIITVFLRRRSNPIRLNYQNCTDRLKFEGNFMHGLVRLSLQILLFVFLILASKKASSNADATGIYAEIDESLNLHAVKDIKSSKEFLDFLSRFADKTRDFLPLSNRYFRTGLDAEIQILTNRQSFELPERFDTLDVNVRQPAFTFTAWVKTASSFVSGYIVRKRVGSEGRAQDLSCWGWYLSHRHGQQLHYGGHDFYEHQAELLKQSSDSRSFHNFQVEVGPKHDVLVEPGNDIFLAMVVERQSGWESEQASRISSPGNVSFYRDGHLLYALPLPRSFTDCFNSGEGLSVGDTAMQLSQLRFYPFALRSSQQSEIMAHGDILKDLVIGSTLLSASIETKHSKLSIEKQSVADHAEHAVMLQKLSKLEERSDKQETLDVVTLAVSLKQRNLSGAGFLAPHGFIPVNASVLHDDVTGRDYYSIFKGPAVLSKPSVVDDMDSINGPRTLQNVPSFKGSGVSFAWWHRHPTRRQCLQDDNYDCSVEVLHAHDGGGGLCWSLRVFPDAIYFENPNRAQVKYQHSTKFMAQHHSLNAAHDPKWRHMVFLLDDSNDSVSVFVDGSLGWTGRWGSSVVATDCAHRHIAFGRRFPAWTNGLPIGVYDLRMYRGIVLSAQNIWALAHQELSDLAPKDRCIFDEHALDTLWEDEHGRGCEWYALHRSVSEAICQNPEPLQYCPVACGTYQACYEPDSNFRHYQMGHQIQTILPKTSKGTFCIDSEGQDVAEKKQQLRMECEEWVKAGRHAPFAKLWSANFRQSRGRRFDLLNSSSVCQDVLDSVDNNCEFNGTEVRLFTQDVLRSGGDFTLSFWVKPIDEASMIDKQFVPQVAFYSRLFPPEHNFVLGAYSSDSDGEFRVHSRCAHQDSSKFFESIHVQRASDSGWSRYTYVRKNTSRTPLGDDLLSNTLMANNNAKLTDTAWPLCFFVEHQLFAAIEFNYPIYITPIELYPEALALDTLQMMYYNSANDVAVRSGPIWPFRKIVEIEQIEYVKRSALVAPPIIFQARETPALCDFDYSNKWLKLQASHANDKICNNTNYYCPYSHAPMSSCRRSLNKNVTYFDLQEVEFGGERGFAEMLYSLTDNEYLLREGHLQVTQEFVDSYTSLVKVMAPFFAPDAGVMAVVTIYASLLSPTGVKFSYSIDFFNMLSGTRLDEYLVFEGISLCLSLVIVAMACYRIFKKGYRKNKDSIHAQTAGLHCENPDDVDSWIAIAFESFLVVVPVSICLRIKTVVHSQSAIEEVIARWSSIDWDNDKISVDEKKLRFFEGITQMKEEIALAVVESRLLYLSLLICMLRMLQQTSLHPRLALITGTLSFAAQHLFHALIVAMSVMCSFAAVGELHFGIKRKEFSTFANALASEISMFFSPQPYAGWELDADLLIFTLILLFMITLLVLNFVLAIIVEAYMQVCKQIEQILIEQNFAADILSVLSLLIHKTVWKWPWPDELADSLKSRYKVKHSIGYAELDQTKLFPTHRSIVAFLHYYKQFDFCEPPTITKFGKKPQSFEEKVAVEVEKRVANLLGLEPITLKDFAKRRSKPTTAGTESGKVKEISSESAIRLLPLPRASVTSLLPLRGASATRLLPLRIRRMSAEQLNSPSMSSAPLHGVHASIQQKTETDQERNGDFPSLPGSISYGHQSSA